MPKERMRNEIKYEVYRFLRIAITGKESGPDLKKIIEIIGLDETMKRIDAYCDALWIRNNNLSGKKVKVELDGETYTAVTGLMCIES